MDLANVNVTLGLSGSGREWLLGKEFPCPVCGAAMPVRLTFKKKPYCHCSSCVLQIFFRGKLAIQRLSGSDSATDQAVSLYNRLQMLKTQKLHLQEKRALFFSDDDLEEIILIFENKLSGFKTAYAPIRPDRKTKIASPESKPQQLPEDSEFLSTGLNVSSQVTRRVTLFSLHENSHGVIPAFSSRWKTTH